MSSMLSMSHEEFLRSYVVTRRVNGVCGPHIPTKGMAEDLEDFSELARGDYLLPMQTYHPTTEYCGEL